MKVFAYAMSAVAVLVVSLAGTVISTSDAQARCKTCKKTPVVRRTMRRTRSAHRPVRTVVRRTSSYRTKHVRFVRTVKVVTHIIPTYRVKKVRTVYLRKIVSYDNRGFRSAKRRASPKGASRRVAHRRVKHRIGSGRSKAKPAMHHAHRSVRQSDSRKRLVRLTNRARSRHATAKINRYVWPGDRQRRSRTARLAHH